MPSNHVAAFLADDLHHDVRDAFLPRLPPAGFRNFGCAGEAADLQRWRGLGGLAATTRMLDILARRMAAAPTAPVTTQHAAIMAFAARDLMCDPDDPDYPPAETPWTAPHRDRLMLAALYGEGPARQPHLYGQGAGPLAPLRLPRRQPGGAIATAFAALHNLALTRLAAYADPGARFAAAQRVTRAVHRAILFGAALPDLLRPDVLAACDGALDGPAAHRDEAPVELTHAALTLLCAPDLSAPDLLRALLRGVEGGVLRVDALAATLRPRLEAARRGGEAWLALDPAERARACAALCVRAPAREMAPLPTLDPPLFLFLWLERTAPAAQGGGDGARLGALGSALAAESLKAIRAAGAAQVERAPALADDLAACFPFGPAPVDLGALLRAVAEPGGPAT